MLDRGEALHVGADFGDQDSRRRHVDPRDRSEELCDKLRKAILKSSDAFLNLPANLPPGPLTDLLLQNLDMPVGELQRAFAEPAIATRARIALRVHEASS